MEGTAAPDADEVGNTGGGNWVGRGHFIAEKAGQRHKQAHQTNKAQRDRLHQAGQKAKPRSK